MARGGRSGRGPAPRGATRSLLQPGSTTEAARSHIATHGRGTSRWLAQEYGVSQRTAQRWLAGTQRPRNASAVIAGADTRQIRISKLRQVSTARLGQVTIYEKSPRRRSVRNYGDVEVDMSPVADLLAAGGSEAEADELARDIFTGAYFDYHGEMPDAGDFPIEIESYGSDPEFY